MLAAQLNLHLLKLHFRSGLGARSILASIHTGSDDPVLQLNLEGPTGFLLRTAILTDTVTQRRGQFQVSNLTSFFKLPKLNFFRA